MQRLAQGMLALAAFISSSGPLVAQSYPARSITIVVPLAAGTGMDAAVRIYAEDLGKSLGKPVIVENQPGASLMLAAQNVARAEPDGHTLLVSATWPMTATQTLFKKINYDPARDFVPISLYLNSPFVLVVNPAVGIDTMQDFIARAKARSAEPLTYATAGTGSLPHLAMETMKQDLSFAATHVPYRNSGQIVTDVVGGHLNAAMSETGIALSLIRGGKLKALGITSTTRHPQLPEVPTMAEAGRKPGFEAVAWHVLLAPSATPRPIVDRLVLEMNRVTGNAAFQNRISAVGLIPLAPTSAKEMSAYIESERRRWS